MKNVSLFDEVSKPHFLSNSTIIFSLLDFHAVRNNLADCFFYIPELLRDGVSFFVAVSALVDFQHDGDAVGVALLGEDGIRDEAAGVGVVDLGGVAGALEGSFGDGLEFFRGVLFVCPDAYVRGWGDWSSVWGLVWLSVLFGDDPVGVAVHVDQQDPGMAGGDCVHSSVVFVVVFQGFLFQVFCDVFDGCSVICLFIAEAHAVLFHGFLFPDEAFHVAEQAADWEVFAHVPAAVGSRDGPDDVRVPHFIVVFLELGFGDDD